MEDAFKLKHPETLKNTIVTADQIFIRNFLFLFRKNKECTHTIILTRDDASYRPTCGHILYSYQILVLIEIKDADGDRQLIFHVLM